MTEPSLNPRFAVYVGSFDPLTLGHQDLIERGAQVFDRLIVGIGINPEKKPLFSPDERLQLCSQVLQIYPNVEVKCFEGLAVNFVKECGAAVMLRGIRTLTDMEAEFRMTLANQALEPAIETVFLMAGEQYTHISSSLIKQVAKMGLPGDARHLEAFVPHEMVEPLLLKFHQDDFRYHFTEHEPDDSEFL